MPFSQPSFNSKKGRVSCRLQYIVPSIDTEGEAAAWSCVCARVHIRAHVFPHFMVQSEDEILGMHH